MTPTLQFSIGRCNGRRVRVGETKTAKDRREQRRRNTRRDRRDTATLGILATPPSDAMF